MSQLFSVHWSETELRPEPCYCPEPTYLLRKVSRLKMFGTMLPYCNFPPLDTALVTVDAGRTHYFVSDQLEAVPVQYETRPLDSEIEGTIN